MTFLQKITYISCFFLFLSNNLHAQKLLQIEKVGSYDLVRFYIGNEVTFKLKSSKGWFTRNILDIDVENNLILFEENGFVSINDITTIQKTASKHKWIGAGTSLYVFGGSWGFWSLVGTLAGENLTLLSAIVPATAFALGYVIKLLSRGRVWKIGKRRRLRVLDLGFSYA